MDTDKQLQKARAQLAENRARGMSLDLIDVIEKFKAAFIGQGLVSERRSPQHHWQNNF